ncbi:hypothetical protein [Streptomyces canus]|uniref:hypothetical protein n=1 Tax=Streptomyces canus TaxID=58343 RepID=UPI003AF381CB
MLDEGVVVMADISNAGVSQIDVARDALGGIANVKDLAASCSARIRDSAAGSDLEPTADQFALSSV